MGKQKNKYIIETIGIVNNKYELNYYIPSDYYFEKIKKLDKKLFSPHIEKNSFFIPPFCYDLYMDTDTSDLSAYALSHMDGYSQEFSYYIELEDYYKNMNDYNLKKRLFELGDKKIFQKKEQIIPFPKESMEISAEALAELDGYQQDFQYYVDLNKYYKENGGI